MSTTLTPRSVDSPPATRGATATTSQTAQRAPQHTLRKVPTERTTRILLVEDEPLTAEVFARALTRDGHVVEVARDGLQALRNLRLKAPSLIVLDISLPTLSGADVVREVRLAGHDKLPIVIVSGSERWQTNLTDADLEPFLWLAKPIKPRTLVAIVRELTDRLDPGHGPAVD